MGETKNDIIFTHIVTKYGDNFITLILTNSSSSQKKITFLGETKSDTIVTQIVTKYGDNFITLFITNSGSSIKKSPFWVKHKVT